MKILNREDVERLLGERDCIRVMRETLAALESGSGIQFLRAPFPLPGGHIFAFMPAWLDERFFGAKVLTVYHNNAAQGFPSHQGSVLLFESAHGSPVAMVDATSITQIRTGAVSAVATELLARPDASVLSLLGSGAQAESHLRAIRHVRPLSRVLVWDIDGARSVAFAERMAGETGLPVLAVPTARQAVEQADILCTLTPSKTPVLEDAWVRPGTHINAVGACQPGERELPSDLMARSRIFGDARESVLKESGDFLIPLQEGRYDEAHLLSTIGALVRGAPGRESESEITVFEALGLAIEDIAAARFVYEASLAQEK